MSYRCCVSFFHVLPLRYVATQGQFIDDDLKDKAYAHLDWAPTVRGPTLPIWWALAPKEGALDLYWSYMGVAPQFGPRPKRIHLGCFGGPIFERHAHTQTIKNPCISSTVIQYFSQPLYEIGCFFFFLSPSQRLYFVGNVGTWQRWIFHLSWNTPEKKREQPSRWIQVFFWLFFKHLLVSNIRSWSLK